MAIAHLILRVVPLNIAADKHCINQGRTCHRGSPAFVVALIRLILLGHALAMGEPFIRLWSPRHHPKYPPKHYRKHDCLIALASSGTSPDIPRHPSSFSLTLSSPYPRPARAHTLLSHAEEHKQSTSPSIFRLHIHAILTSHPRYIPGDATVFSTPTLTHSTNR